MTDKRKRFELLMRQAEVPVELLDSFFHDGWIDRVECSRSNKEWTIYIGKSTVVPAEAYRTFCLRVQDKLSHIAKIKIIFHYEEQLPNKEIVDAYWSLFMEWVKREVASVNGWLHKGQYEVEKDLIKLFCRMRHH